MLPLPRERAKAPYTPRRDRRLPGPRRCAADTRRGGCARPGLVCLGAGAGLIRADLRQVRGSDIICRSGGVIVTVRGARPRIVPVLARYHQPLLASAAVRRGSPGHRRHRPGAAEHHQPADPVAGRRDRPAPAGHQPAAGHLAGRLRRAARPARVHARRRDHLLPAARRHHRRPGARRRGAARWSCWAGPAGEQHARRASRTSSTAPASRRRSRRCSPPGCGTASCRSAPY